MQVDGLLDDLALGRELKHAFPVLARREPEEQAALHLPLQLPDAPAFERHLLLIEAAFERVADLE
nr:hypothetical protein [Paludisphaera rhizosphaerae]